MKPHRYELALKAIATAMLVTACLLTSAQAAPGMGICGDSEKETGANAARCPKCPANSLMPPADSLKSPADSTTARPPAPKTNLPPGKFGDHPKPGVMRGYVQQEKAAHTNIGPQLAQASPSP